MKAQLEERLGQLKTEFESGQQMLVELEAKQANLRETLLRISGAIQVLEELLKADGQGVGVEEAEEAPPQSRPIGMGT